MLRIVLAATVTMVLGLGGIGCGGSPEPETDPTADMSAGDGSEGADGSGTGTDRPDVTETPIGGDAASIGDIFFEYDRYELRSEARRILQENARYFRENPGATVILEGHCDERGTTEYNLALGQRRADAVRDYLLNLGVDRGKVTTRSYGEEKPFALGSTESAWSQNRRVHFRTQ